jgi:type I restriction enzyme M protein
LLDAAVYERVVRGFIFLEYVSEAYQERRAEMEAVFHDRERDYYPGDGGKDLIPEERAARH